MGFYPKKRARRIYPRTTTWIKTEEAKPLGFAGYKAGMTHVMIIDTNPNSKTKGQHISKTATILDCPPLSVFGFRCYHNEKTSFDVINEKLNENLSRKLRTGKIKKLDEQLSELHKRKFDKVFLLCHTNPNFKKTPEIFEIALGGHSEKQLEHAKHLLGKELKISDIFKQGDYIDVSAVTKGKGTQGPVKRFGIKILRPKASQMQRHTGSLGQTEPGKIRPTTPMAGQLGFQTRTELNKRILMITDGTKVNPKGGFINYGNVSGDALILQGSVPGPRKRLIRMRFAIRPSETHYPVDIKYISLESKQGV